MNIDLSKRVAIVTGGARGIGRATAQLFAEAGAAVAIFDTDVEAGQAAADAIGGMFVDANVAERASIDRAVTETLERLGRIDVLVNNAGIIRDAQLVKVKDGQVIGQMSEAQFDQVIDVNLKGVFHCTQAVIPTMVSQKFGRILNARSVVGLYGNFGQTNYAATKSGVSGMTKVWARELGPHGITANAIAPGFIRTEMVEQVPEKIVAGMVARTPVGRLGRPEEIASAYLYLASENAGFINGAVLSVDGGLVLGT